MKGLNRITFAAVLALIITLLVAGLWHLGFLERFEFSTLNWRFEARHRLKPHSPDPHILLIGIDDTTVRELGGWPFPRSHHGEFTHLLESEKPAVLAWDILFTEAKENDPKSDGILVEAASGVPKFISGAALTNDETTTLNPLGQRGPTQPLPHVIGDISKLAYTQKKALLPFDQIREIAESAPDASSGNAQVEIKKDGLLQHSLFGFVDCEPGSDGVRRTAPLVVNLDGQVYASLALQTVIQYVGADPKDVTVELGKYITIPRKNGYPLRVPVDSHGQYLINFENTLEELNGISYFGIVSGLLHKQNGTPLPKDFPKIENSIGFIALTGVGLTDTGATPLQKNSPLVAVHLAILDNILQGDYLANAPTAVWVPFYFLLIFGLAYLMRDGNIQMRILYAILIISGFLALSFILFIKASVILPTFLPIFGLMTAAAGVITMRLLGEEKDKAFIKKTLSTYLSKSILDQVLSHPDNVNLGGSRQEITVLFSDIRGFTKYCDEREPEEVVEVLNLYLEAMTDVIFKYDGTLDKYIGDAIMAFWGFPQNQPDHAQRAVCAAMEMRYALSNFKSSRAGIDRDLFECGIGIHTGPAIVGNIGSSRFRNYTVIGSTVNLAARLEALTKRFTSRIIISEDTRKQIEGDFTITDLGDTSIPGFSKKTRLYSIEAFQDISSALKVGRKLAQESNSTVSEVSTPLWAPAPLPEDADPNP